MVAGDWQGPLMFGAATVLIGWCSMRESPHVYKIDKIRCYCLINGYCFVTTLVHVIYLRVNPGAFHIDEDSRNQLMAIVANSIALCLFAGGTYLSKQLYDELRLNHQFPDPEYMEEASFFGGNRRGPSQATQANRGAQPAAANMPRQQQQAYQPRANAPPPSSNNTGSRGFQAFSGTG